MHYENGGSIDVIGLSYSLQDLVMKESHVAQMSASRQKACRARALTEFGAEATTMLLTADERHWVKNEFRRHFGFAPTLTDRRRHRDKSMSIHAQPPQPNGDSRALAQLELF
jgi:hypothetical protein